MPNIENSLTKSNVVIRRGRGWPSDWSGDAPRLSSHLVTKFHRAALVGFNLHQMKGYVSVELVKEWDPFTNQDGHDRITNFVGEPEAKAVGGDYPASNKPDRTEHRPQTLIHELREIA